MKIVIPYLEQRGFDLLEKQEERFLMKKGQVCVVHHGNNCYEIFKHVRENICYSETIRQLKYPDELLTKALIINGL